MSKKINVTLFYSEANCHSTSRWLLSVFMKATRWRSSSSSCQKVLANIPVCERHKQQQDTDFKERRDACMTTRPFLNHTLISKGTYYALIFSRTVIMMDAHINHVSLTHLLLKAGSKSEETVALKDLITPNADRHCLSWTSIILIIQSCKAILLGSKNKDIELEVGRVGNL